VAESEDPTIAHPEVVTLHWEGPDSSVPAPEPVFPDSPDEMRLAREAERQRELDELCRGERGRALWTQIEAEARQRGEPKLWQRKLHAFLWVKLQARGSAGDYARRFDANHATVRTWIADVSKLAYEVGYRLHEDRLLLVGEAPARLARLRELVNEDAASQAAQRELERVRAEFRGEDGYFHLNEGHIHRAHGRLAESDVTLREGLTISEARPLRALLWNARGQTFWDCAPDSAWPLPDALERSEKCFRRAIQLDPAAYFPFVNLAQLAMDAGDSKRAEYWIGELSSARKRMSDPMKAGLARYLREAEWTSSVEGMRFWRNGPMRWLQEAGRVVAALALALALTAAAAPSAQTAPAHDLPIETVAHGGGGKGGSGGNRGGAGGNRTPRATQATPVPL
jgi:hypothetical protein